MCWYLKGPDGCIARLPFERYLQCTDTWPLSLYALDSAASASADFIFFLFMCRIKLLSSELYHSRNMYHVPCTNTNTLTQCYFAVPCTLLFTIPHNQNTSPFLSRQHSSYRGGETGVCTELEYLDNVSVTPCISLTFTRTLHIILGQVMVSEPGRTVSIYVLCRVLRTSPLLLRTQDKWYDLTLSSQYSASIPDGPC